MDPIETESYLERAQFLYLQMRKRLRILPDRIDYLFEEKLDLEIVPTNLRYMLAFLFVTSPVWVFFHLLWMEREDERKAAAAKIREQ